MRWILCLLSLLPAAAPVLLPVADRVLDTATAPYFEDAPARRPIARVAADLIATAAGRRLRLAISAIGAGIDPLPGIEGAPGANLRTAEELERLLREDALRLIVRRDGESFVGTCIAIEWATVPVRRIDRKGFVDFDAVSPSEWPVAVEFEVALPESDDSLWCYLEAAGVPRLAVQITPTEILAIESRGERETER